MHSSPIPDITPSAIDQTMSKNLTLHHRSESRHKQRPRVLPSAPSEHHRHRCCPGHLQIRTNPLRFAKATDSRLILIKVDLNFETDPFYAASSLFKPHSLTSLDILIANAGILHSHSLISTNSAITSSLNIIALVLLFQAIWPLLQVSLNPKFLALTSLVDSIVSHASLPGAFLPYGAGKAALNWVVKRIYVEEEWLCAYVVSSGLVLTDTSIDRFGEETCRKMGAIEVEKSVECVLRGLDGTTREASEGVFRN